MAGLWWVTTKGSSQDLSGCEAPSRGAGRALPGRESFQKHRKLGTTVGLEPTTSLPLDSITNMYPSRKQSALSY